MDEPERDFIEVGLAQVPVLHVQETDETVQVQSTPDRPRRDHGAARRLLPGTAFDGVDLAVECDELLLIEEPVPIHVVDREDALRPSRA